MDTFTHSMCGLISYYVDENIGRKRILEALIYIIAANIPDIDHTYVLNRIGLNLPNYARTWGHSIIGLTIFTLLLLVISRKIYGKAMPTLLVQPTLHVLILDELSTGPIYLLWPFDENNYTYKDYLLKTISTSLKNFSFNYTCKEIAPSIHAFSVILYITIILTLSRIQRKIASK